MGKHKMPLLYIYQRKEKEIEICEQDFVYQKAGNKEGRQPLIEPLAEYRLNPKFEEVVKES
ncbi:hypothetical protein [Halalkalibacter okhensis]|uniref:Uncharacterized protein n=1 Tax=Halalkalibacter okhensis TaxID=333138 RepID=A0A0B0IDM0_9BACI|nr:hypothetical protein [Halalkalibacter okhensis]KHF37771.1 hypothetical protein LQ50_25505 [Halalkalibacter okhensis]